MPSPVVTRLLPFWQPTIPGQNAQWRLSRHVNNLPQLKTGDPQGIAHPSARPDTNLPHSQTPTSASLRVPQKSSGVPDQSLGFSARSDREHTSRCSGIQQSRRRAALHSHAQAREGKDPCNAGKCQARHCRASIAVGLQSGGSISHFVIGAGHWLSGKRQNYASQSYLAAERQQACSCDRK